MAPKRKSVRLSVADTVVSSQIATPEPPLPSVTRRITRKSVQEFDIEIPDSDDIGDVITVQAHPKPSFRGVFLPTTKNSSTKTASVASAVSTRPSSIADSFESNDHDTPDTSAMTTPAGQDPPITKKTRVTARSRSHELANSTLSMNSSFGSTKRSRNNSTKRGTSVVREDVDAQLAARLQAEEYEQSDDADSEPLAKKRRVSKAVSSSLSDLSDSDEFVTQKMIRGKTKRKDKTTVRRKRVIISDDDDDDDDDVLIQLESEDEQVVASSSKATRLPIRKVRRSRFSSSKQETSSLSSLPDEPLSSSESAFSDSDDSDISDASDIVDTSDASVEQVIPGSRFARRIEEEIERRRERRRNQPPRLDRDGLDAAARRAKRERTKLEKSHPEIKTMWDELAAVPPIKPVALEQPIGISRKLKSFQLEGLDWMIRQEKSHYKGGLLGDEMGMGKTIQAVSLIMSDYPAKKPSLVVVPPVALMQWQSEIADYTSGKLKVLIYHVSANPKCKLLTPKDLKKYNVIMVSYSGLESMYRKETKGWNRGENIVKEDSILHSIQYHRVILDEAHSIKQRTTSVAKACFALRSDHKWCLSGTPVQNRIGEFFSLLRFLEVVPFACYFCKQCDCKELHWSQDEKKMCNKCKHSGFNHVSVFNQEILNPITSGDNMALRKVGLDKLRLITDRIMLRRMKRDHTSSMELPPKDIVIHREFFGEIEKDFSQSIMSNSTRKFDTYVAQGVMLNNYANIFGLIMQMRQVANHPDLILRKKAAGGQNVLICCICDEPAEEAIRSRCRHEFCRECAKNYVRSFDGSDGSADCPQCHIALEIDFDQPEIEQDEEDVKKNSIINRIKMENWTSSTKIEMLVYDLYKLRSKKQTHKSIVFSQFTSMLQLVQWRLQKSGFSTVLLDGSMTPAQRQKSIDHFMNNVDVEVFLVSLKAGGVALNLTEASRVFIIDPWWNPAAEWQSADRCHRIGQRRPCVITRLCIEDSVESRMVLLQEKKANMINGTVNNDQVALDKLTPEDMQFLFRGA